MPIHWRLFAWCGTGGTTTYIIDLGDVSIHQEESGHILSPGDMLTGRSLGILTIVDGDEGGGLGGGGDAGKKSMSGCIAAPWGAGVPEVVVTEDLVSVGYAGGSKVDGNGGDVGVVIL